ncbi:transaldolase family protein [Phormidesmis sp. 146-12]
MNLLQMLRLHRQAVWLSCFDRRLVESGQLQRYLDQGLQGILSSFSSIERSLHTSQYDRDFQALSQTDVLSLYNFIAVREMQLAAERLKEVHDQTDGKDGYVSLELPPYRVSDPESILTEARQLWRQVGWSNFMVNIPAAPENKRVIQQLVAEGINVNATQVVSLADYERVVEAYLTGLEAFAAQDGVLDRMASAASVPVSQIEASIATIGIAQANVLYQRYQDFYHNNNTCSLARRWRILAERGAHPQRLVWMIADCQTTALTQHYAESLMRDNTIMVLSSIQLAMPYENYLLRSHSTKDLETAHQTLVNLVQSGISLDQVAQQVRIEQQARSQLRFEQLLQLIEQKQQSVRYFD